MLVLDNQRIMSTILTNGQILEAFPLLYPARKSLDSFNTCPACQKNAAGIELENQLAEIKKTLATLPAEDKARLKSILGVSHIRVYYSDHSNGHVTRKREDF
jgi:hypothetical protein